MEIFDDRVKLCSTCRTVIRKRKIPRSAGFNGFRYPTKPNLPDLNPITRRLVSPGIPFKQVANCLQRQLESYTTVEQVNNVPIDLQSKISSLPRNRPARISTTASRGNFGYPWTHLGLRVMEFGEVLLQNTSYTWQPRLCDTEWAMNFSVISDVVGTLRCCDTNYLGIWTTKIIHFPHTKREWLIYFTGPCFLRIQSYPGCKDTNCLGIQTTKIVHFSFTKREWPF